MKYLTMPLILMSLLILSGCGDSDSEKDSGGISLPDDDAATVTSLK